MCVRVQNGLTALHLASKEGHVHVVAELLRRDADIDIATKVCTRSSAIVVSIEILPIATQQCRNYLYDKS